MHSSCRDMDWLVNKLAEFAGGQIRTRNPQHIIFQGKFSRCAIPDLTKRHIVIHFEWLCELRVLGSGPNLIKWIPYNGPVELGFDWKSYYVQKERVGDKARKERLKLKPTIILPSWVSREGDELWFYREGDPEFIKDPPEFFK